MNHSHRNQRQQSAPQHPPYRVAAAHHLMHGRVFIQPQDHSPSWASEQATDLARSHYTHGYSEPSTVDSDSEDDARSVSTLRSEAPYEQHLSYRGMNNEVQLSLRRSQAPTPSPGPASMPLPVIPIQYETLQPPMAHPQGSTASAAGNLTAPIVTPPYNKPHAQCPYISPNGSRCLQTTKKKSGICWRRSLQHWHGHVREELSWMTANPHCIGKGTIITSRALFEKYREEMANRPTLRELMEQFFPDSGTNDS